MKLLILGGSMFVGYHMTKAALDAGHEVTLFNRGKTDPDAFPEAEKLIGDRMENLTALQGRQWDAVIDTSGYLPRVVKASVALLADQVKQYIFISTISVYQDFLNPGVDETYPVSEMDDPTNEDVRSYYDELKVLCERTVEDYFPERGLYIRAGLIAGPRDPLDRFTYWPTRMKRGGDVLVGGNPDDAIQFIDVRDLAEWTIRMIENEETGVYNATGPDEPLTMQQLLETCRQVTDVEAKFIYADSDFLMEKKVIPWDELPLWNPKQGETAHMTYYLAVSNEKARAKGLRFRPLQETIRDILSWDATRPVDQMRYAGLAEKKEQKLLKEWLERTTQSQ
ncbi:SDR family oxidoreductase [Marinicrinis sediminis]|uniref:SDR family oxidoreductase n=1 Tax=Marinicrinis sediminis TaxID=1652465 RepID=A0ABW5RH08_9BACL